MLIDTGLLVLRIVLGIIFMGHGAQKLFGWFGGPGMKGVAGWLGSMRLRPAAFWAWVAALSEFGGGGLLVLGFLWPLGSLGIIATMITAIAYVHAPKGLWNTAGGYEYPLVIIAAAFALGLTGPGAYSLDAMLGFALPAPLAFIVGLVAVVLGLLVAELTRSPQAAQATTGKS